MKYRIKSIALLLILFVISVQSFALRNSEDDKFAKDVRYLFLINGSESIYKQTIKAMIEHFKSQESDVPSAYWQKAETEFLNTSIDELIQMLVPIYKKNLSHEDVLAMISFYESDAGKRIAAKMPVVTTESMQAGMMWGQAIGMKIAADIESKGYKIRLPFMP